MWPDEPVKEVREAKGWVVQNIDMTAEAVTTAFRREERGVPGWYYGMQLVSERRFREAMEHFRLALVGLNPQVCACVRTGARACLCTGGCCVHVPGMRAAFVV